MAAFDLESLKEDPNKQVILTNGSLTVTGYLEQDFEVGGSAVYDNPFEQFLDDKSAKLQQAAAIGNQFGMTDMSSFQLKSRLNTISLWTGSERPTFNIPFTLVRKRATDQPVTAVTSQLTSYLYPIAESGLEGLLSAPGGYATAEGGSATGTWTLKIGRWFRATGLILLNASFTHSKAVTTDDSPLYATGTVSMQPYRMISASEFRNYFLIK
ncbi:hypothetical protein GR7B_00140 [Vibrio phage vB_VcorM_GR7B]|nr:hypothetical protein GR7B_00140 [Vibrio phage vB_VcorM_GR7B]